MARRMGLRQYQRQQHIEHLLATEREIAALQGQLSARLPAAVYADLAAGVEARTYEERFDYLLKAANRVDTYLGIVAEAERITLTGDNLVDIQGGGQVHKAVPASWKVMTHLALTNGWTLVGRGLLQNGNGAKEAATSKAPEPAPEGTNTQTQDTTAEATRQIDLVVTYETDEARERPRIHNGGELAEYKADGKPATPPTQDLNELYRWLMDNGYFPAGFQWLGRAIGYRRQRRQTYRLASEHDKALPVEYSRGRAKLFKS